MWWDRLVVLCSVVSYVFMVVMSVVESTKPFNGKPSSNITAQYPTKFSPAPYAFSIWIPIYIGLGLFVIYQALPKNLKSISHKARIAFIVNGLLNGLWNVPFSYGVFWLSLVVMAGLLGTLIFIYFNIKIGKELGFVNPYSCLEVDHAFTSHTMSFKETLLKLLCVEAPFSVYLGWISVAIIANLFILFTSQGIVAAQTVLSIAFLFLAFIAGILMLTCFLDVGYSITVVWGIAAVAVGQKEEQVIQAAAIVLAGTLGVFSIAAIAFRTYKYYKFNFKMI
eukprot:TRINITY_DN10022_c0_g1_i1.p1 TRINITY_DN10022_c0_g1~~TRINITY_DN10022_c0_g1_i1.p1  ORF type:complete len:287 (+),score=55.81 TRINITY_DN10022_c0_g1_i1:24-863(+)